MMVLIGVAANVCGCGRRGHEGPTHPPQSARARVRESDEGKWKCSRNIVGAAGSSGEFNVGGREGERLLLLLRERGTDALCRPHTIEDPLWMP